MFQVTYRQDLLCQLIEQPGRKALCIMNVMTQELDGLFAHLSEIETSIRA